MHSTFELISMGVVMVAVIILAAVFIFKAIYAQLDEDERD
jgi:hypothetical protein